MSQISRYKKLKLLFKNYLIIFYKDNDYHASGFDGYIFHKICNSNIKIVENKHISYVIIDTLDLLLLKDYEDENQYNHYYNLTGALKIMDTIKRKIVLG